MKNYTKKDICTSQETVAYYSGFGGLEIKEFEYGIEDYVYFVANAWQGKSKHTYHKAKVYYDADDKVYFKYQGVKIPLCECIRTNF